MLTNTPVPMIDPSPIIIAPKTPTSRRSDGVVDRGSFGMALRFPQMGSPSGHVGRFTRSGLRAITAREFVRFIPIYTHLLAGA
jgi:hypothetical protein